MLYLRWFIWVCPWEVWNIDTCKLAWRKLHFYLWFVICNKCQIQAMQATKECLTLSGTSMNLSLERWTCEWKVSYRAYVCLVCMMEASQFLISNLLIPVNSISMISTERDSSYVYDIKDFTWNFIHIAKTILCCPFL